MTKRILIIGGVGVFGKRLVRHLANRSGIALFVSSRTIEKSQDFVRSLTRVPTEIHPVALDRLINLKDALAEIRPHIVVDCSGPFQGADYDAARMILQAGAHLIDLADARDYLANFAGALDQTARDHHVTALTGASSTPALSTAVATQLTEGWRRVDAIDIAITPGGRSEVGRSVIEAIMSYAGENVPIWEAGRLAKATGWREPRYVVIPGLGRRRVAAVETFDAEHLGASLNVRSRVSFSAGLESWIEQFGIEAIAALRRRRLIGDPSPLIPWLLKARRITRIPTSASGGMLVEASGLDGEGEAIQRRWSLVAHNDHGPFIPILPAAAAIERLLEGATAPGARAAHSALTLSDILKEMEPYEIHTKATCSKTDRGPFERALGAEAFAGSPEPLRRFHSPTGAALWSGEADVDRGRSFASKAIAWLFGFPDAGRGVPVTVSIDRMRSEDGAPMERWTRDFAGTRMRSALRRIGGDRISERFAPFSFDLALKLDERGLHMPVSGWRLGRLPLPKVLAPKSETREYVDETGRFRFDVRLSAPVIGLLVHYRGWLEPVRSPG